MLDTLDIYYQNVRGLRTKTEDFFSNIVCSSFDVIILTETWLNSSIFDSELFDNRYLVYRRDRETSGFHPKKDGGGVLVAVSTNFASRRLPLYESKCEDLWISIDVKSKDGRLETLLICAAYLPPPIKSHVLDEFLNNSNRVLDISNADNILMAGDFNLGNINWSSSSYSTCNNSLFASQLLDFMSLHSLTQYNYVLNSMDKTLDLILCNKAITKLMRNTTPMSVIDPLHPPLQIFLSLKTSKSLSYNNDARFCFYRADYDIIVSELNKVPWNELLRDSSNVNEMITVFYNILHSIIEKFVPKYKPKKQSYPIWFSFKLKKMLKEKYKLRMKLRKNHYNPLDQISFSLIKKRCFELQSSCYVDYKERIEKLLKSNPKLFWSFYKSKRNNRSNYPEKMTLNELNASNGPDICDLYVKQFSSVYNTESFKDNGINSSMEGDSLITTSNITVTKDDVFRVLKRMDPYKGAGADKIPSVFAVRCATALAYPLSIIFNKSLSSGVFPSTWKKSLIVPIFKSGNHENVCNYRPISILVTFAKVFEKVVYPIINWHFKQIISQHQHGFFKGRSTLTNLVCFLDKISSAVDSHKHVDVIYTDFSKAFDKVPHRILTKKLSQYGIIGPLLEWFSSYLKDRNSVVVVNGYQSQPFKVLSGVPQGSHLGPILFNIFINDIKNCFTNSNFYLFADDLKFFRCIDTNNDVALLQNDLDRLVSWCDTNGMNLNIDKCYSVGFTRKKQVTPSTYKVKDSYLKQTSEIKDLGIYLDNKLRFHCHIDKICKTAFKNLGFILRNSRDFNNPSTVIMLYNTFVRSGLEYCSVVWNPFYKIYIKRLESVQKRFMWHLTYKYGLAKKITKYNDRLTHFNMKSLSERRCILDNMFFYKLINCMVDCPELLSRIIFCVPCRSKRLKTRKIFISHPSKTNLGINSSVNRLINSYNSILSQNSEIDIFNNSLNKFKKNLSTINFISN